MRKNFTRRDFLKASVAAASGLILPHWLLKNEEATMLAGAYLEHEIGHMLFHFGHPFGMEGCVMTPAELLNFKKWYSGLNSDRCGINSNPDMFVGSGQFFFYNEDW